MIEKIVKDYLTTSLSKPHYMEVPENTPAYYGIVEKTGSRETNRIHTATVAVQSCAPSLFEAAKLNELSKAAMKRMIAHPGISKVRMVSDYNFTDTSTKQYRYQAVYDITYMEE